MPRQAKPQEWADFVSAHKCHARQHNPNVMEHVLDETGEVIGRVEYSTPERNADRKYFIFPEVKSDLMRYICFYNGKTHALWAKSMLLAKEQAVAHFKPPKSKRHMVSVVLSEKDGQPVTHSTSEFG